MHRQKDKTISRKGDEESMVDRAKTTHLEINLRSRQKQHHSAARKQHGKDSDMPSTADSAETPHVDINIRSRHHSTAEQSCMQTTRQSHGHATRRNVKQTPRSTTTGNELMLL